MFTEDRLIWRIWSRPPGTAAAEGTLAQREGSKCSVNRVARDFTVQEEGSLHLQEKHPGQLPTFLLAGVPRSWQWPAALSRPHLGQGSAGGTVIPFTSPAKHPNLKVLFLFPQWLLC